MSLFTSILQNLKQKIDSENAYKDVVVQSIKEVVGITVSVDAIISYKDGVLTMKLHPTVRSAVLLKQTRLLHTLKEHGLQVILIR
jgi:hypothetical protein